MAGITKKIDLEAKGSLRLMRRLWRGLPMIYLTFYIVSGKIDAVEVYGWHDGEK